MIVKKLWLSLFLVFLTLPVLAQNSIEDYQRIHIPIYTISGDLQIAIRVFKINGIPSFLTVNPDTLTTQVIAISSLHSHSSVQTQKAGLFYGMERGK